MTSDRTDKQGGTGRRRVLSDAEIEQRRAAGRQRKTMTPAALEARQQNAQHSTGPKTPEGKAASSRNAYKHGLRSEAQDLIRANWLVGAFARPCTSTCQWHPSNPNVPPGRACTLVLDGLTSAGGDCLDKTVYITAFDALVSTLQSGQAEHMHEILAAEAAGAIELLQQIRQEIASRGLVIFTPMVNKSGDPVIDQETGKPYPGRPYGNPALPHYTKLLGELGLNLPELLATPRALKGASDKEDAESAIASMLGGAFARLSGRRGQVIDGEAD